VPEEIAMNLTIPEHVTRENMDVMRQLVANGPKKWPGAKYIIRNDGK
jgi:DNA-directed RNA polymerase subunit A'